MTSETRTQHTPGPWHVNAIHNGRIVGDETTDHEYDKLMISNHNATVATVYRGCDARLIAAAPDLLAALERMADMISNGFPHYEKESALYELGCIAQNAIAAARGDA